MDAHEWTLRRGALAYPQPIAVACGRVIRARTAIERIDACLKAGEILTRYLAAIARASFSARDAESEGKIARLQGDLAFGDFLSQVQEVAASKSKHPAAPLLAQGFKKTRRNRETKPGPTDAALVRLLELRNRLGHDLRNLGDAQAIALEQGDDAPLASLVEALDGVEALLSCPLFVLEAQEWKSDCIEARRLLLMGESGDPFPEVIRLKQDSGVSTTQAPHVAMGSRCLPLPPTLLWDVDVEQNCFALHFLDAVNENDARYCTIAGSRQTRNGATVLLIRELCGTQRQSCDTVLTQDGRDFAVEWVAERTAREEAARRNEGFVDWGRLEEGSLVWYARMLGETSRNPVDVVKERLLDGRSNLGANELRQLMLLFGTDAEVRAELGRDVLDLRVLDEETQRPSERELIEASNLINALKRAVSFLAAHTGIGKVAAEDFKETEGSLDYLTLREVLVNQMVHQDYLDESAAGQVELRSGSVTVFNTGYSLVDPESLLDGGKSQSRNPLIARALRAIGFAEISGSGIRAVQRACQKANRRAPTFVSDRDANTFTLTLDWTDRDAMSDSYWRSLVGVDLTAEQAQVLNAVVDYPSVTISMLEGATGLDESALSEILDYLLLQKLVEEDEANYRLSNHIRRKLG